jgi:hypothetical protein
MEVRPENGAVVPLSGPVKTISKFSGSKALTPGGIDSQAMRAAMPRPPIYCSP